MIVDIEELLSLLFIFNLLKLFVTDDAELEKEESDDDDVILELDEERDELLDDIDEESGDGEYARMVVFERLQLLKTKKTLSFVSYEVIVKE